MSALPRTLPALAVLLLNCCVLPGLLLAQTMAERLGQMSASKLQAAVNNTGNATRGAVLFHGAQLACGRCHSVQKGGLLSLGPNLAVPLKRADLAHVLESILTPSKEIAAEFTGLQVLTHDGEVVTGLLSRETPTGLELRTADTLQLVRVERDAIAESKTVKTSLMPEGLMNGLGNMRDAFDLLKYISEIQSGGFEAARKLQPSAAQLAIQLPEYESQLDHAGMISDWDTDSFERGRKVYEGLCVNCHGTRQRPGSLATALRFGEGKFKYGSDPYSMYQTLTRGAGMMLPQPWMVPQQKYDVIHYVREHFGVQPNPPSLDAGYLAGLPPGTERGPAPRELEAWSLADYGPRLIGTYEIGAGGRNIAQKGIAVQLDASPGGVANGNAWAIFDHDTMRLAAVWSSREFIDWQGINFNGRHNIHPHIVGDVLLANPTGPGWAEPKTGKLADDARVVGRDGKRYGPLPSAWASYTGLHQDGNRTRIDYRIGTTAVSESFDWQIPSGAIGSSPAEPGLGVFVREIQLGRRTEDLQLVVATQAENQAWQVNGKRARATPTQADDGATQEFTGSLFYESEPIESWNTQEADFAVLARASISGDGTIFAIAPRTGDWAPGGQALFVRGGRLVYDIGWEGAVQSRQLINDGKQHTLGLMFNSKQGLATLWIDGKQAAKKQLASAVKLKDPVLRIGKTADNFPETSILRQAQIHQLQLFDRQLTPKELATGPSSQASGLLANWDLGNQPNPDILVDALGNAAKRLGPQATAALPLRCGLLESHSTNCKFSISGDQLLLNIPAGPQPIQLHLWSTQAGNDIPSAAIEAMIQPRSERQSGPTATALASPPAAEQPQSLFSDVVKTQIPPPINSGEGFAVDVLQVPKENPWNARLRLTGMDFFADPDRLAVCTWDGDVWEVSGLADTSGEGGQLQWKRIAFGLFQPLGLKIIKEQIYLTCRDQLVRLDDTDADGQIDYYHCINNDHQVTEHFHEFAMGLQTDAAGNFYYAKSARHALPAVVPHHGTLLRVSPDGSKTDIVANGFRAANGVCLNPDGSFIVTDQEGHWNPKNRINWVQEGGFYGNMYGYHDVTDESDLAMEQPLCWITNAFDRSPAELLWCDSPAWGEMQGTLLNLSYGYGQVFVVPHERVHGQLQGGMCALPIPNFPTGIVRGRFSPHDGQLYVCGLSAWASSQTSEEGGFYRIRYTGQPAALPLGLAAEQGGLLVTFSEPLGPGTSLAPQSQQVRAWDLKRTKNYGSKHFNERELAVTGVELSDDRRQLRLVIPELEPTWGMEVRLSVETQSGKTVERVIHNTIHRLADPDK